MEKLKMHSPNLTQANIERLMALFPNCMTESRDEKGKLKRIVDFDLLRQELSETIVEGPIERYHLNWPGKREALLTANAPIAKTLRPCREESVDFDTTKNLFIEGDNLDALKLLQDNYLGKIKMIYIDPPYNTGNDFIYDDDFSEGTYEYLLKSNQKDSEGNRLVANTESNGRFHSDWLSMMYPRLKLARNLLRDNGVIFISIDDSEQASLKNLCDEIFGEKNFIGQIVWNNATDNNPTNIAIEHEYIICYAKSHSDLEREWKSHISDIKDVLVSIGEKLIEKYEGTELQQAYNNWYKENKSQLWPLDRYKYIDKDGVYTGSQSVHNPGKEGYRYDVIHPETGKPCQPPLMGYRFPQDTMNKLLAADKILFGEDHKKIIELKVYAKDYKEKLSSIIQLDGRLGAYDLREDFPELKKAFTNPKPVRLLNSFFPYLLKTEDDIALDFFAGSCSTAKAIWKLNLADGISRRFILVQLPEDCDEKSEAAKAGYKTIPAISKERIRRAGNNIKDENAEKAGIENLDIGFRVLKVDTSNMRDVYYNPDLLEQTQLTFMTDNIKSDRTEEDLLFQVLLDWGIDLDKPIERQTIDGKTVYFVEGNDLVACFDSNQGITEEFVKKLTERQPLRVVFRDAGFKTDSVRINVEQVFKLMSPVTDVKVL